MRQAKILYKDLEAGILTQHDDGSFTFRYHDSWIVDSEKPSISLAFSKSKQEYTSNYLFPFFYNMLPEGFNKHVVCRLSRIEPDDYFGLLLVTAKTDSIGAIRVVKIENE
jgi:serine/threonine-protein kinase HipA